MFDETRQARNALDGAVAIVTGAGGIGRATCRSLSSLGCRIVIADRDQAAIGAVVDDLAQGGAGAAGFAFDVRSENDMDEMARRTLERYDRIDILVACAGVLRGGSPRAVADVPGGMGPDRGHQS